MTAKRKTFADRDAALSDAPIVDQAPEEPPPMVVPPTLGPGDDDPKAVDRGTAAAVAGPLGPGDDDPRPVNRGAAGEIRGPLGPGDADPRDTVNRNIRMLAQPAPGPGETFSPRRITVFSNEKE